MALFGGGCFFDSFCCFFLKDRGGGREIVRLDGEGGGEDLEGVEGGKIQSKYMLFGVKKRSMCSF